MALRRRFLALGWLLGLLVLAGCQLTSDNQILPEADGEALFGDKFLAVQFKDGLPAITEPESLFFAFIRDGGAYVSGPTAAQRLRVSFHRFAADPGLWIVQLVQVDKKQVNYLLAKRVDNRLYIDGVGVDAETLEIARDNGVAFEGDASKGASITSRPALEKMLKTYADVHRSTLNALASKSEYLAVGQSEAEMLALAVASAETNCLALTGHPLDTMLANLPPKYRGGVYLKQIDIERAKPVCDQAADFTWDTPRISSRFGLLRIYEEEGDYGMARVIADDLMKHGYGLGYLAMAELERQGHGGTANPRLAETYLREGAAKGLPVAQYALASYIEMGRVKGTGREALDLYLAAKEGGLAPAGVEAGRMMVWGGNGVLQDLSRGRAKIEQGVAAGLPQAMVYLGNMYYQGVGIAKDRAHALKLQLRAAEMRNPQAQYSAGFMLTRGQGGDADPAEGARLMKLAMDAGLEEAKAEYGYFLLRGLGVPQDAATGRRLLTEVAANGNATAKQYLAEIGAATGAGDDAGAAAPPTGTGPETSGIPAIYADYVRKLWAGEDFGVSARNAPFLAGMADVILQRCELPGLGSDREQLQAFVTKTSVGTLSASHGSGGGLDEIGPQLAGQTFGKRIDCARHAQRLMTQLAVVLRKTATQDSFVSSCAAKSRYGRDKCDCLAGVFETVHPEIRGASFSRRTMEELIGPNPVLGIMVGLTCGIYEY